MNDENFFNSRLSRPPKSSLKPVLLAVAASFALGAALMGWFAWENGMEWPGSSADEAELADSAAAGLAENLPAPEDSPSPTASETARAASAVEQASAAVERVEQVAQQTGGYDQRLAGLEQRIANLDLRIQAASGNAARAEGLLIAFATRRQLEKGAALGYLEGQLKLRFGDANPNAVNTIVTVAGNPITLDQLISRLDGLGPRLASPPVSEDGFDWFLRELGELFVVRRESAPSPQPQNRLQRARLFLESRRIEDAIAEVRYLPGADQAEDWIADATRFAEAQAALDRIESTAVLEPRELRDGSGNKVEQPSPVE